jgi:hypothetical protein
VHAEEKAPLRVALVHERWVASAQWKGLAIFFGLLAHQWLGDPY